MALRHFAVIGLATLGAGEAAGAPPWRPTPSDTFAWRRFDLGCETDPAFGDFDGNGYADVAFGTHDAAGRHWIKVAFNDRGVFETRDTYALPPHPSHANQLRCADLNTDGHPDIVAHISDGFSSGYIVSVMMNSGDGTFAPAVYYRMFRYGQIALGDFDGDEDVDVMYTTSNPVTILRNNGDGTLAPETPIGMHAFNPVFGDIDGDGDLDFVGPRFPDGIYTGLNDGTGVFAEGPFSSTGTNHQAEHVALADLDGDDDLDVVLTDGYDGVLSVFINHGDGSVASRADYPGGGYVLVVEDLNRDGKPDITTGDVDFGTVTTRLNTGGGAFGPPTSHYLGAAPISVDVGDFNRDGHADIAAKNTFGSFTVLLGDSTSPLPSHSRSYPGGPTPGGISTADLDGDGDLDVGVINSTPAQLVTLRNDGTGLLEQAQTIGVGTTPTAPVFADFDGNGSNDVLVANQQPGTISVLRNIGTGVFAEREVFPAVPAARAVAVGDLDGDSDFDVVVASATSLSACSLLNNGASEFPGLLPFDLPDTANGILIGYMDGDSKPDLVVLSQTPSLVTVLKGIGEGHFFFGSDRPLSKTPSGGALVDIDGDGDNDLVIRASAGTVLVLKNDGTGTLTPQPEIHIEYSELIDIASRDINGDGIQDVFTHVRNNSNSDMTNFAILYGKPGGGFLAPQIFAAQDQSTDFSLDDIDGDLDTDVVVSNRITGSIRLLLNLRSQHRPSLCPADVDGDGYVNAGDFSVLAANFGTTVEPVGAHGDLNRDGVVNVSDFLIFATGFGCEP